MDPLQNSPDTSLTVFGMGLSSCKGLGSGRPARSQADKLARAAIDEAQGDVGEADEPMAVGALADGDGLAGDGFGHEEQRAAPPDLAARPNAPDLLVRAIGNIAARLDERPGRRAIELGRLALAQRLVRPLMVELVAESIETALLVGNVGRGRPAGLGLEGAVHALMAAILLRLARPYPLEPDAHPGPSRRQPGQAARAGRGEGCAVVAADCGRQPVFCEQLIHLGLHRLADRLDRLDGQQVATEGVGHRERAATLPIAGAEPALEVDAPGIVGCRHGEKRLLHRQRPAALSTRLAQTLAAQDLRACAEAWPGKPRFLSRELAQQLLGTPMRPPPARLDQPRHHLCRRRPAMMQRRSRTLLQAARALRQEALPQGVADLTRDPVTLAQRCHRLLAAKTIRNKQQLLIPDGSLGPRHWQVSFTCRKLSGMYPDHSVSHLSGSNRLIGPTTTVAHDPSVAGYRATLCL